MKRTALCVFAWGAWQEAEEEEEMGEGGGGGGGTQQDSRGETGTLGGFSQRPLLLLGRYKKSSLALSCLNVGYLEGYDTYSKLRPDVLLGYCDGSADTGTKEDYSVGECFSPVL